MSPSPISSAPATRGVAFPGCVCCVYTNAVGQVTNSRCRPPGTCSPGTQIGGTTPAPTTTTARPTTTSAPTTTSTTTTAAPGCPVGSTPCNGVCCPSPCQCLQRLDGGFSCVNATQGRGCSGTDTGACDNGFACIAGICRGICGSATTTTAAPTTTTTATPTTTSAPTTTTTIQPTTTTTTTSQPPCIGNGLPCTNGLAPCCDPNRACIGGVCAPRGGVGQTCDSGQNSDCQDGLICCAGICRDPLTDSNNCRTFGTVCDANECLGCFFGTCILTCGIGTICFEGGCAD